MVNREWSAPKTSKKHYQPEIHTDKHRYNETQEPILAADERRYTPISVVNRET